ncbi:MAG: hypothetical protein JWQ49_5022 [Edaphobacter sp.]|nr:hypothetical protein [Edaphobacter sp.]
MSNSIRRLPPELRLFCVVTLWATAVSWLVVLICHRVGFIYIWPLYTPWHFRGDYYLYYQRFDLLHHANFFTAKGFPFAYMAPAVPLYKVLYLFGDGGFVVYLAITITATLFGLAKARRIMLRRGVNKTGVDAFCFTVLLTSYPLMFCIHRGNIEILIAIGIALGTWAYWKERTWTAAILWGVFGSVKLYPLLLPAIFLSFRQYRQFLVSILAAMTTTFLSLLYIGPNLKEAYKGISGTMSAFLNLYTLRSHQWMGCDHSPFALIKLFVHKVALPSLLTGYMVSLAVIMLALYFVRIRKLPVTNQLLILTVSSVLLPPTSYDYTLLHLYAPFIILVFIAIDAREKIAGLFPTFASLGLLFTPTNFFFYSGHGASGQVKCLLLLALMTIALIYPFPSKSANTLGERELIAAG